MGELWDIYDKDRKKIGKFAERGVYQFETGEYHIAVTGIIINSKNEILISKRAEYKKFGGMWECNGGSVLAGETSLEGIIRELQEELGIKFSKREAIFFKRIIKEGKHPHFKEFWLFKKDINDNEIVFKDGEATDFLWVTIDKFIKMCNNKEIIPTINLKREDYELALKMKQRESYSYIGKNVEVYVDRPLNSKHPKYNFEYLLNYGYVPNTISGDGEELDCYILGVDKPIKKFEGKCIAVIHRINDDDDKLIITEKNKEYTDEEIRRLTNFQEKNFESEIIR